MKPEVKDLGGGMREVTYKNCQPIKYKTVKSPFGLEANIDALHPAFRDKFRQFLNELRATLGNAYDVIITCTFRSFEEQEKLYKENPKTATKPGESPHNFGLAADFSVIDKKTQTAVTSQPQIVKKIEEVCRKIGLFYGMWFVNFTKEPWHVQVAETPRWRDIYNNYRG